MSNRGDQCTKPKCTGTLIVRTSRRIGSCFELRLKCNRCGGSGGTSIVPGERVVVLRPTA